MVWPSDAAGDRRVVIVWLARTLLLLLYAVRAEFSRAGGTSESITAFGAQI